MIYTNIATVSITLRQRSSDYYNLKYNGLVSTEWYSSSLYGTPLAQNDFGTTMYASCIVVNKDTN